ncbi:zinc finger protein 90 [Folsomia candida]|uniref:zinc finger protein 90 n=1 Tax=Folsomia candida TaxID=158441 RepID=UPI001604DE93|nr:zinc finger protein 90 [Folsomia candida]
MCGTRCRDLDELTAHQKKHAEPPKLTNRYIPPEAKVYSCKFCDKRFARQDSRCKHVSSVHKGKRYKCDLCQNTCTTHGGLSGHRKYVHNMKNGEDKSKCPYDCDSALEFETEAEWIQHLEGCTSEKITEASQCPCLFCDAVFRNQFLQLSHHHQTHETFPCEICSKQFSKKTILAAHKFSHEESKPHLCSKCGKRFREPRNLRLHSTTICGDDDEARKKLQAKRRASDKSSGDKKKNFNCDECSMGFITSRRFELHKVKVHGGEDAGGERRSGTEDSDTDA